MGPISIVARCLSSATGLDNQGLWTLPLTGRPRWYGRAGGTLEDAGIRASSPHTTQSGSARSRIGPHLQLPGECGPAAGPPVRHLRVVPSGVPQSVCGGGPTVGARTRPSAWDPGLVFDRKRTPQVSPESPGSAE